MDIGSILSDLNHSTQQVQQQILSFTTEDFNRKPSGNKWSAAQISEHLLLLEVIANKVLSGETIATNRPPDGKISLIKTAMEDSTKRVAPERVQPSSEPKDPQIMVQKMGEQRNLLVKIIRTTNVAEACISHKHPALGTLTRLEWIYFTIYHTQRHVQQLQQLKEVQQQ